MIVSRLTNLGIAILAVPILGVAAVTLGQEARPTQVLGDMLTCPNGSTVQSAFTLSGDNFTVTGLLVSLDTQSVTVTGPSGDVTATLTVNAEVDAGLQPGMPATVHGQLFDQGTTSVASTVRSACNEATEAPTPTPMGTPEALEPTETPTPAPATGEPDDDEHVCNRGPGLSGEFRLDIKHGGLDIKRATVASASEGMVTITTPSGDVNVMIGQGTEVKGDLSQATEIRVKGTMSGDMVQAEKVQVLCPGPAHMEDENDDDAEETPPALLPTDVPVATMEPEHADDEREGENDDDHGQAAQPNVGSGHGDEHGSDHHGDSDHGGSEHHD